MHHDSMNACDVLGAHGPEYPSVLLALQILVAPFIAVSYHQGRFSIDSCRPRRRYDLFVVESESGVLLSQLQSFVRFLFQTLSCFVSRA